MAMEQEKSNEEEELERYRQQVADLAMDATPGQYSSVRPEDIRDETDSSESGCSTCDGKNAEKEVDREQERHVWYPYASRMSRLQRRKNRTVSAIKVLILQRMLRKPENQSDKSEDRVVGSLTKQSEVAEVVSLHPLRKSATI